MDEITKQDATTVANRTLMNNVMKMYWKNEIEVRKFAMWSGGMNFQKEKLIEFVMSSKKMMDEMFLKYTEWPM